MGATVGELVGASVGVLVVGANVGAVGAAVGMGDGAVGARVGAESRNVWLASEPEVKVNGPATVCPDVVLSVQSAPFHPSPKLSFMSSVCSPTPSATLSALTEYATSAPPLRDQETSLG